MSLVRLSSVLLIPCAAGILTVGCGQESTSLYPTSPSAALSSTARTGESGPQMSTMASSGAGFNAFGQGTGHGNGQGNGQGGGSSNGHPGEPANPAHGSDDEGHGNHGELSGFVTAVAMDSLTVRGMTVRIGPATVIRHGNRRMTLADIRVGDHVQVRGVMDGTTFVASEIKLENTGRDGDNDDDEDEGAEVHGAVSGRSGTCPSLTFMVGTTRVTTTGTTRFRGAACAAIVDGARVEVRGARQADRSIVAATVEFEDEDE